MFKRLSLICGSILFSLLIGCAVNGTIPKNYYISTGTLTTPDYQLRESVSGQSCSGFYLWGFKGGKIGSVQEAIENAIKNNPRLREQGDGIVMYKEKTSLTAYAFLCLLTYGLVCPNVNCVNVQGTMVKKFEK
ncbi:MAG: hypothetical protein NT009_03940 [Proteobacteria bacterium]|nr:hypothetical protein [Pseudomonadota bacterium]